jgi:hypothetical protein
MITRRESLLSGAALFASGWIGEPSCSAADSPVETARKNVGKRACEKCDDRGQVQKAAAGGNAAGVFSPQGMPAATWLQEGFALCPDCVGESKEFRVAVSQYKEGVLPWIELAKRRIDKLKSEGKFEAIKKRAAEAQPEASMFLRFGHFAHKGSGGVGKARRHTYLLTSLRNHYRSATLTRGVVRAVILRWGGAESTKKAVGAVENAHEFIDRPLLLTCRDLIAFAASTLDVKYRGPCGFPPKFESIPTLRNKSLPDTFAFHYLG